MPVRTRGMGEEWWARVRADAGGKGKSQPAGDYEIVLTSRRGIVETDARSRAIVLAGR